VNRIFETWFLLMLLIVVPSTLAQTPPPSTPQGPEMTISVHNYADVPSEMLGAAEDQAREIYRRAGLETVWLNCSSKLEKSQPESCYFSDSLHLTLKIIPRAVNAQVHDRIDVLGTAYPDDNRVGYFAYVFYNRVEELAGRQRLGRTLLADVMAHEIGHLLLGSNSHSVSGIMCARWNNDQMRNIAEGAMSFLPSQSKIMRERLSDRQRRQLDLPKTAPEQRNSTTASTRPQDKLLLWSRERRSPDIP
jgi:hypothetical protein